MMACVKDKLSVVTSGDKNAQERIVNMFIASNNVKRNDMNPYVLR